MAENNPQLKNHDLLSLSIEQQAVINSLIYFDVFKHPLTKEEIHKFVSVKLEVDTLDLYLNELKAAGLIKRTGTFYHLNLPPADIETRIRAEGRFKTAIQKARRYSAIIARFPFVRGVCLSGSISKGVAYEDSDIDYFVIAKPNRLWISKLLIVLFKKTVLLNHHRYFCVNYYIDNEHLELEEKNLFTATELITVIPRYGYREYETLVENNQWVYQYFPNFKMRSDQYIIKYRSGWMKKALEFLLDNKFGDIVNRWFMKVVWNKYNKNHSQPFTKEQLEVMFKSKPYVSKVHHSNNQQKLLDKLWARKQSFEKEHGLQLKQR